MHFLISYSNSWQASSFILLLQEQQAKTLLTAERGHMVQPSLLKALFKAYGLLYLFLGIIKLVNDILNFAGPLLLNVLIRYLETPSEPFDLDPHKAAKGHHQRSWWLPQPDSLAFGLCCAGLLGITSLIKVCMHAHLLASACHHLDPGTLARLLKAVCYEQLDTLMVICLAASKNRILS